MEIQKVSEDSERLMESVT